jgi:uncharacterized damage-inducible protein DinB
MSTLETVRTMIAYNCALHRRTWDSIDTLSKAQFQREVKYSHGSLHNHMLHIASVDRRWLSGLKELPDVGHLKAEEYATRESVHIAFDDIMKDVTEYVAGLTEAEIERTPAGLPGPRWLILLHLVNHGTDHRAQVLRILTDFGAPTFDQDFVKWLWERK